MDPPIGPIPPILPIPPIQVSGGFAPNRPKYHATFVAPRPPKPLGRKSQIEMIVNQKLTSAHPSPILPVHFYECFGL
jgi:hypothetical protein